MRNKFIFTLLLLNIITTLMVGYVIYNNYPEPRTVKIEPPPPVVLSQVEVDEKFRTNMYQGLGLLMSAQSQISENQENINIALLRVHHFVEPHGDKFYTGCPECQKEKKEILEEEQGSVTSNVEGL